MYNLTDALPIEGKRIRWYNEDATFIEGIWWGHPKRISFSIGEVYEDLTYGFSLATLDNMLLKNTIKWEYI